MVFLSFLIVPMLIAILGFVFSKEISPKEFAIQVGAQFLLIAIMTVVILNSNYGDVEILNGRVTEKNRRKTSCEHSYPCRCRTVCSGSGKNRSCYVKCDTCYDHFYDINWNVLSSVGDFRIKREDRQGLKEPKRWTAVTVGEPASATHSYENFIKGSPDSLFNNKGMVEKYKDQLPEYPGKIFDYYRINRVVQVGVQLPNVSELEAKISELNAELGPKKQVNFVLVVTKDKPQDFFIALEQYWLGAKKNDAVLVLNLNSDNTVGWASVMSLSNEEFKIALRNKVLEIQGEVNLFEIVNMAKEVISTTYIRRPMSDFEYLKESAKPTPGQWIFGHIIGLILAIGLTILFHKEELE